VAFMPQGDALFPGLTVRQNLDSGAYTSGAWRQRRERRERVLGLFPAPRLRLDVQAAKLSGGERRMLSIGRALMSEAAVYLVDEPSLGLSPKAGAAVVRTLLDIDIKGGAMVIAEQNIPLLSGRVDRLLGMHSGRIKFSAEGLVIGRALGGGAEP
jgi:branched-chain amino acid transport system ATP-binding protein